MHLQLKSNKSISLVFLGIALLFQGGCKQNQLVYQAGIREDILHNKNSFFYLDVARYPKHDKNLPVGIFDSGTGGLTILDAIVTLDKYDNETHEFNPEGDGKPDFGSESFIYLGDQANMPYGNYPAENNTALLKEHIFKDVQFLLGNRYYLTRNAPHYSSDKEHVKAIVIACNTATAFGKKDIEAFMDSSGLGMQVIGVIDAGVKAALQKLDPAEKASVAIMATAGTVASNGYVNTMHDQMKQSEFQGDIDIYQQAGIGLAGAIDGSPEFISRDATAPREEYKGPSAKNPAAPLDMSILKRYGFDWAENHMLFEGSAGSPEKVQINSIENYISYHLVTLLEKIRKNSEAKPLRVIILGCTHYPFYQDFFQEKLRKLYDYRENGRYIYRPVMFPKIEIVDPAVFTAEELYIYLTTRKMSRDGAHLKESEFYISVPNTSNPEIKTDAAGGFTYDYKYGRKAGYIQEYVRRVPFTRVNVPEDILHRFRDIIPVTYGLMEHFDHENPKTSSIDEKDKI
ncbi:MAG: Asp/Glu/hydantoin racemase [Chlorobi bacterium]|nr:Asp/Glu/hydantoin racemase [Chlorobiota bacterium]